MGTYGIECCLEPLCEAYQAGFSESPVCRDIVNCFILYFDSGLLQIMERTIRREIGIIQCASVRSC